MIVKIYGKAGEGKSRELINYCETKLKSAKKVIYCTTDPDYKDWVNEINYDIGLNLARQYLRAIHINNLEELKNTLPIFDQKPYDVIALDNIVIDGATLQWLHNQANDGKGIVVYTISMDDAY